MQTKAVYKFSGLTNSEDVARWLRNLERGSAVTAEVSVRRLGKACELLGMDPSQLIAETQKRANLTKIVRQWLRYNSVILTRHVKIRNVSATPTIENERVLSQQELAKMLRNSPSRVRVAELLMAFGGLRPESIGNF